MNDTRAQNLRPFASSMLGGLAVLTVATAACDQGPSPLTEDQFVATDGVAPIGEGLTLTPVEPVGPPVFLACPRFRVIQPLGSFQFDNGTAQDWTMQGLFDGDTANRVAQMDATPAWWWDQTNAPGAPFADPVNNNLGSLMLFTSGGFAAAPSGFWREDFVSPDLGGRGGWQASNRFSFQIFDDMSAFGLAGATPINAQLLAEVEKCDGTTKFLRQVNAAGPVFCAVTPGTWVTCTFTFDMTNVRSLRRLHIRAFGNTRSAYEGGLFVDNVRAL